VSFSGIGSVQLAKLRADSRRFKTIAAIGSCADAVPWPPSRGVNWDSFVHGEVRGSSRCFILIRKLKMEFLA
jgi:hypothetical protein